MAYIYNEPSHTFSEYLLLPGLTKKDCIPGNVSLKTPIVKYKKGEKPSISLNIPMVSAVMQAKAMDALVESLSTEEAAIARRGRNTKSTVPKSASVREYRQGTAWEALVGWLFLSEQEERLEAFLDQSFTIIQSAIKNQKK